ncbi:class I SAM-dependent methyltransferase [Mumia zhuanghuii]|uniref:class I SAM-dependent methyltransferase n=1 Tax=Mumia zhuanghuii TaxID=2585211 RepID=UPI0036295A6D
MTNTPAAVEHARLSTFDTMLGWFPPGRLVDIGAGHGAFSTRAADCGWTVTAVDARSVRFPDDPRVTWVERDVREAELYGYDLIVNLGLLYHLTLDDQLSLLDRASGIPMILDTHVSPPKAQGWGLSEPTRLRGYTGRLYSEEGLQHKPTASWGNDQSFWPTPRALRRMLHERGWNVLTQTPYYMPTRTFFLCMPR